MADTRIDHLADAERFLRDCSPNDPCEYDNTCFTHKARWHVREAQKELATLREQLAAAREQARYAGEIVGVGESPDLSAFICGIGDRASGIADERDQARRHSICNVCDGKNVTDTPCICGDTGLARDAVIGFQKELVQARRERDQAQEQLATAKAESAHIKQQS